MPSYGFHHPRGGYPYRGGGRGGYPVRFRGGRGRGVTHGNQNTVSNAGEDVQQHEVRVGEGSVDL